jgi:hypothetical protein
VFLAGALASCMDGVRNGNEVGVDCGGPNCGPCSGAAAPVTGGKPNMVREGPCASWLADQCPLCLAQGPCS